MSNKKINDIISGWENFMFKSEVTEELARDRAKHCAVCPHLKKSWLTAFINDEILEIKGRKCTLCDCPSSAKLRSINEECPIQKW